MKEVTKDLSSNDVMGLNNALAFLLNIDLKDLGVETTWSVVEASNAIQPVYKSIQELGGKVNREFYEFNEETKSYTVKDGMHELAEKAQKAIEAKTFKLNLKTIPVEKILEIKGLKPIHLFQLQPYSNGKHCFIAPGKPYSGGYCQILTPKIVRPTGSPITGTCGHPAGNNVPSHPIDPGIQRSATIGAGQN